MGNHVENALIAFVSDTGDDGQREVRHIFGQCQSVETTHIGRGTTTSNDDNTVERESCRWFIARRKGSLRVGRVYAVQRIDDALLDLFALHDGRKEFHLELKPIVVVGQLPAEVAVASRVFAGDDGDVLAEHGQLQFALHVEDPLFLELSHNFLPSSGQVTHGVCWVYVVDNPRKTVSFVEVNVHPQQHFHACMESLSSSFFKAWAQLHPCALPAFGRGSCHGSVAKGILLHQFHVAMASHFTCFRQFGFNPIVAIECSFEHVAHQGVQLEKGESRLTSLSFPAGKGGRFFIG